MTNDAKNRKRRERERKRKRGLKPLEIWAFPEHEKSIKDYADMLRKSKEVIDS